MIIYGSGGMGREVLEEAGGRLVSDDNYPPETWCGTPNHYPMAFVVAVGDGRVREQMTKRAIRAGHVPATFFSERAHSSSRTPGEGTIVMPGVLITSQVTIGKGVLLNTGCIIPHDCILEDWCSIMPGAVLSGRVHVKRYAMIGLGARVVHRRNEGHLVIGEGAVIGAGAVVLEDVPDGETWVGNPARVRKSNGRRAGPPHPGTLEALGLMMGDEK